jgi:hypothetical protein
MGPEVFFLCSQQPDTGTYPEPDESVSLRFILSVVSKPALQG